MPVRALSAIAMVVVFGFLLGLPNRMARPERNVALDSVPKPLAGEVPYLSLSEILRATGLLNFGGKEGSVLKLSPMFLAWEDLTAERLAESDCEEEAEGLSTELDELLQCAVSVNASTKKFICSGDSCGGAVGSTLRRFRRFFRCMTGHTVEYVESPARVLVDNFCRQLQHHYCSLWRAPALCPDCPADKIKDEGGYCRCPESSHGDYMESSPSIFLLSKCSAPEQIR